MRYLLVCSLTLLLVSTVLAQEPELGAEVPVYPQIDFGQFGWDTPEVATVYPTSANPAAMAPLSQLRFFGLDRGAEVDASQTWFGRGFSVNSELFTVLQSDRRQGVWRASWYGYRSTRAPLAYLPQGMDAQVTGEQFSVAYARQKLRSKWRYGIAISPLTRSWINMYRDDQVVGHGSAQGAEITVGAQFLSNRHLTFGFSQRYQCVATSLSTGSEPTRRGTYHAYATTVGAEWKPDLRGRTTLFADVQYVAVRGPGVRDDDILLNGGVNYHIGGRWITGLSTNSVSLTYGRDYDLYAGVTWAFTNTTLADKHFGRSSMVMLWASFSW